MSTLLGIGSPFAYLVMFGVVYGLLPYNWKNSYEYIDDQLPRFFAAALWPITAPALLGWFLVHAARELRAGRLPSIPKATARTKGKS